jgi:hypothetical protein
MSGMDYIEVSPQRFRVDDFDGDKFAASQFSGDRNLRKETETEFALHHFFSGFNCFHFQDNVRQQTSAAEKALTESPIAGAAIEEDERPRLGLFETNLLLLGGRVCGMAYQY